MGYGVPSGYIENPVTTDEGAGAEYWTSDRIAESSRHQWDVYRLARRIGDDAGASTVLDVGCGPATKLEALFDRYDRYGVDQPATVEICQVLGRSGSFRAVDFSGPRVAPVFEPVDLVICADVIEHLADPMPLLRFIRESCAEGGRVVLSTPERRRLCGKRALRPSNVSHVREWDRREFEALVRSELTILGRCLQLPFRPALDAMTARWLLSRAVLLRSLRTTQVLVATPR